MLIYVKLTHRVSEQRRKGLCSQTSSFRGWKKVCVRRHRRRLPNRGRSAAPVEETTPALTFHQDFICAKLAWVNLLKIKKPELTQAARAVDALQQPTSPVYRKICRLDYAQHVKGTFMEGVPKDNALLRQLGRKSITLTVNTGTARGSSLFTTGTA